MMIRTLVPAIALLALLASFSSAAEPPDILILTPRDLIRPAGLLAAHRGAEGHTVQLEVLEDALEGEETLPSGVKALVRANHEKSKSALRFLLLMGDAPGPGDPKGVRRIPPKIVKARFKDPRWPHPKEIASDAWYGLFDDDALPTLAVGRLPADNETEAETMVKRIIAYERSADFGAWRKTLNIVAGTGGFGPMVDAFIESTFKKYMTELLDPAYDVTFTYANPASPFCFPPPRFSTQVVDRINAGSLVTAYVGHGAPFAFDRIRWSGETYPIFNLRDAGKIRVRNGAPVVVIIACSTGHFDHRKGDCISEALMKRPMGPVAVFSSTRISQPYANAIVGRELIAHLMAPAHETVGEAVLAVKKALILARGKEQEVLDRFAMFLMKPESLEPCREDHVHLYNLFGDPAMVLRYPRGKGKIEAPPASDFGREIEVGCALDRAFRGKAVVTLEAKRGVQVRPLLPVKGKDPEAMAEALAENWKRANDTVLARVETDVDGRRIRVRIRIPDGDFPVGEYVLKLFLSGERGCALAHAPIRLGGAKPEEDENEREDDF